MLGFISLLCFLATSAAEGDPESLVCMRTDQSAFANVIKGPPGEPGVPGLPGLPGLAGPRGRPGRMNNERLEILIEDKVAQAIFTLRNTKPEPGKSTCTNLYNKVTYEGKCFWAILPENEVKFLAAERLCLSKGGKPANIYSESHYQKLMSYLHEINQEFYYIYTGMQFDPDTSVLSNYDGTPTEFSHWRSGDPVSRVADPVEMSRVAINIHPNQDQRDNGMLTSAIIWPKTGVLCEA